MPSAGTHRLSAVVFLVSLVATVTFRIVLPDASRSEAVPDYTSFYEPVARALLDGRGPVSADGSPALRYPPGYPMIVAGLFGVARVLRVPEAIAMDLFVLAAFGLTTVCLFGLARLVWGATAALVTAAVWTTYPFALWLTRQPSSDLPFMVVLFAAILLWARTLTAAAPAGRRFFAVGMLAGIAMLIRPIAIGLGAILAVLAWAALRDRAPGIRRAAVVFLLAGNLAAVLPWEVWVYRTTGEVIPLSTGGLPSMTDGLTFAVRDKGRVGISVPDDVRALMLDVNAHYDGLTSLGAVAAVMTQQWDTRPMAVIKLYGLKWLRSWYGTDSQRFERPILAVQLCYLAALLWCAWRAATHGAPARRAVVAVACLVGYFQVMNLAGLTLLRYAVPAMGLAMILLPVAVSRREPQ